MIHFMRSQLNKRKSNDNDISDGKKQKNIITTVRVTVNIVGLWLGPEGKDAYWARVASFCYIVNVLSQMTTLFLVKDDIEKFFEGFSVFTFSTMGIFKLFSLRQSSKEWLEVLSQAQELEDYSSSKYHVDVEYESEDELEASHNYVERNIESYSSKFRPTWKLITRLYLFTVSIFVISPFIEYEYYRISNVEITEYPHVLPGWVKLDSFGVAGYVVTIVFEIISAMYCVLVHLAFDVTLVGLIIFMSGQFALLRERSAKIGGGGKKYQVTDARDARAHFRIIKCHRSRIFLVKLIQESDKLMRLTLGMYFLFATLTLCAVALRFSSEQMSAMQFASLLQYMAGTVIQLYLYCHYGDLVLNESYTGMGEGPFAASFWCLSPRVRRDLCLLSIGLSKQHRINAGLFNSFDLPSFVQIVRMAYSCYAVFRNKGQ